MNYGEIYKCVYVYDIEKNAWFKAPDLNQGRISCSSCAFNQMMYTFGGAYSRAGYTDSIERINARDICSRKRAQWNLVQIQSSIRLTPRQLPIVYQISPTSIIILGGENLDGYLDDVWQLDVESDTLEQVSPSNYDLKL